MDADFRGGADACQLSPAHLSGVIAVAASDDTDTRWPSSNYGSCVDLYAPGVDIVSAYYKTDTGTIKASGTSMSCPLVSGAVAQYLQLNPNASPNEVRLGACTALSCMKAEAAAKFSCTQCKA